MLTLKTTCSVPKSKVIFSSNTNQTTTNIISTILNIDIIKDLESYLGILVITGKKEKVSYAFIINRVKKKLLGWKANSLYWMYHSSSEFLL